MYQRRSGRSRTSLTRRRVINPFRHILFGPKVAVKFIWNDFGTLDPGASQAVAMVIYSANGMFDPGVTAGAVQPRGYDELMSLYDHYCVVGSRCKVQFSSPAATTEPAIVGISLKDNPTTVTSLRSVLEDTRTKTKNMNSDQSATVYQNFSARKFFGRGNPLSNDDLRGVVTAQPAEQAYYHVWATATSPTGNLGVVNVIVTIEFLAILSEQAQPAIS